MGSLAWSGTFFYTTISLILTIIFGLAPIPVSEFSSWIGINTDKSIVLSWIFLTFVFIFCLLIPICSKIFRGRMDPKGKAVLITGCDSGFGFLLAKQLDARGMHVFAGCLLKDKRGEGARKLEETCSDRTHVIQLDITSDQSVKDAVKYIQKHLPQGSKGLWGLVNNAGTSAFGEVEWSSISLYKNVAEVNLWGTIRVTKACLPMIRRTKGRIVTVTSGLSRMAAPSRSVYVLSKFAVDGFMTCLRYEMNRWGVKVSVIEPGNYIAGTRIMTKENIAELSERIWNDMEDHVKIDCGKDNFDKRVAEMVGYCNSGMKDLTPVTNSYEDALLSKRPLTRYRPMTLYWRLRQFVMTVLPDFLGDYFYIYYGSDQQVPKKLD